MGLIATGVPIFVLVQARLARRAAGDRTAPAAPGLPAPGWAEAAPAVGDGSGPRRALAVLLLCAGLLAGLSGYSFYRAYSLSALHVPHAQAAADLQVEVLEAHSALEALVAAGGGGGVDRVWDRLESARRRAEALLEGVRGKGLRAPALAEETLRRQMGEVRAPLASLEELALRRYLNAQPSVPEDEILAREYGGVLAAVTGGLAEFRRGMVAAVIGDQERLLVASALLLSAAFLLAVVLAVGFYRYEDERTRHLQWVREARERAEEGREFFRQIVQQAADPFLVFSPDGRVVDGNRLARAWLGYGEDELLALSAGDVIADCPWQELAGIWARLEPGAPVSLRALHRRRDGSTVAAVANLGLLRWGERSLILHLARETGTAVGQG